MRQNNERRLNPNTKDIKLAWLTLQPFPLKTEATTTTQKKKKVRRWGVVGSITHGSTIFSQYNTLTHLFAPLPSLPPSSEQIWPPPPLEYYCVYACESEPSSMAPRLIFNLRSSTQKWFVLPNSLFPPLPPPRFPSKNNRTSPDTSQAPRKFSSKF